MVKHKRIQVLVFSLILMFWTVVDSQQAKIEKIAAAMKRDKVIPDVIDVPPDTALKVSFDKNKAKVTGGNILSTSQTKEEPKVNWVVADKNSLYVLIMLDPDVPSRSKPKKRELIHWFVGNIPMTDVTKGKVLATYIAPAPSKGTDLHRYVLLVFKQSKEIDFKGMDFSKKRTKFSIRKFATKYKLGKAYAGNFFQAEYDTA